MRKIKGGYEPEFKNQNKPPDLPVKSNIMYQFKFEHSDDLNRLKKSDIIKKYEELQDYALKMEKALDDKGVRRVSIDRDILFDKRELFEDVKELVKALSLGFSDTINETTKGYVNEFGVKSNLSARKISPLNPSWPWYSGSYLIPEHQARALETFLRAINRFLSDKKKQYKEEGRNFLIQQITSDVLGDIK